MNGVFMLTDERYKQLMEDVGLPNSRSLLQALKQCAMEAVLSECAVLAKAVEQEPVEWQYLSTVGGWSWFANEKHKNDTIEDGRWPIRALYAHPLPAQAVPEGWQLVPIEPTKEMCDAYCEGSIAPVGNLSRYGYKDMLSASPKP